MYRKYYQNDELTSNVLISFALFVMFGIMFYFIYYDTGGFTYSSYLYVGFAGLSLLISLYHLVIYLISLKRPILDYEVDLKNDTINFSKRRRISFKKIKLYAIRENRSEVKIFYRGRILNIIIFQLKDDDGNKLTYELSDSIGKYSTKIGHRQLYNYNFLSIYLMFSLNLVFVIIQDRFPVLHQTYKYFIVLGLTFGVALILILINLFRLNRYYKIMQEKTSEHI